MIEELPELALMINSHWHHADNEYCMSLHVYSSSGCWRTADQLAVFRVSLAVSSAKRTLGVNGRERSLGGWRVFPAKADDVEFSGGGHECSRVAAPDVGALP
jgi:hypothetical protein